MASGNCSVGWTFTSQEDFDSVSSELIACSNGSTPTSKPHAPWLTGPLILLRNATGNITFPGPIWSDNVTISDSPALESLDIAGIYGVQALDIAGVPILRELRLPMNGSNDAFFVVQIRSGLQAPEDVQTTEWNVYGSPFIPGLTVQNISRPVVFHNVSNVSEVYAYNSDVRFPALNGAGLISIEVDQDRRRNGDPTAAFHSAFKNLSEVYSTNITGLDFNSLDGLDFEIHENLTMKDVFVDHLNNLDDGLVIPSIRGTLTISEASDVPVSFTNLTTIGGDLVFANSSGCSLSFRELTEVSAIWMQNNTDTTLPGNMDRLELADSIHLNGFIDTSAGGNIFPSLKLVRDSVMIEAWNEDFNCSELVRQRDDGVINHLYCNGTDDGNSTANSAGTGLNGAAHIAPSVFFLLSLLSYYSS